MTVIIENTNLLLVKASVNKAISELTVAELVALQNQLRPNNHVFVCKNDQIKSCHVNEIKRWAKDNDISFAQSDSQTEHKVNYCINDTLSYSSFSSEQQATIDAFETYVVSKL